MANIEMLKKLGNTTKYMKWKKSKTIKLCLVSSYEPENPEHFIFATVCYKSNGKWKCDKKDALNYSYYDVDKNSQVFVYFNKKVTKAKICEGEESNLGSDGSIEFIKDYVIVIDPGTIPDQCVWINFN